ncbi:hypothetical protein PybrP1_006501 [[Pythium] brassicae (nom. inval.)]|nr:hypothetical protein PybrP1_006501 [[Pythium] brassicae (nom. inval.)]
MSFATCLARRLEKSCPCAADEVQPLLQRSTGVRVRFAYFIPVVGRVCKGLFECCFQVSPPLAARYKAQARAGCLGRTSRTSIA